MVRKSKGFLGLKKDKSVADVENIRCAVVVRAHVLLCSYCALAVVTRMLGATRTRAAGVRLFGDLRGQETHSVAP